MRRAERLFRLVQEMRQRTHCRAEDLAETLGVHVRTIYRDIAHLQGSGLPIEGAAGVGYVLRPGFDLPPMTFSTDQIEALALGLRFVEACGDPDLAANAVEAWSKIEAVLPEGIGNGLGGAAAYALKGQRPSARVVRTVRNAIRGQQILEIEYSDGEGNKSRRRIRPLALMVYGTGWMVACWCELREGFRFFRLDRVQDIRETSESFSLEEDKNLETFIRHRMDGDLKLR